ncbi:MAG: hypothetical protein LBE38_05120 [Deltaproteobacteria bacterium]|jgi:hypothetical protein|nr:hypothetical protein [Deltaproteobacteria bacterium]
MTEKPKNRAILIIVFTALLLTLPTGCTLGISPLKDDAYYREDENFQDFLDIPFPTDMNVEKSKTVVFTRREVLSGHLSLVGSLSRDELMDYFDRHLPPHGWTPHSEVMAGEEIVATWAKPGKTLTIIASKPTLALGVNSRAELYIAPPLTKDDLGQRTIYESTTRPPSSYSTTPVRSQGGTSSSIGEENL